MSRDALLVDAEAKLLISDGIDIGVSCRDWFSSDVTSDAITARLGVRF